MDRWNNRVAVCVGVSDFSVSSKIVKVLDKNSVKTAIVDADSNLAKFEGEGWENIKKVAADLTKPEDIKVAFDTIENEFGQVHIKPSNQPEVNINFCLCRWMWSFLIQDAGTPSPLPCRQTRQKTGKNCWTTMSMLSTPPCNVLPGS